jgi:integrase
MKGAKMGKNLLGKEIGKGLSQLKDGRYRARFTSVSGKRVDRTFNSVSYARTWLADTMYLDTHGNISASSNMTVDTWFMYWIDNLCKVAPQTKASYMGKYNTWIKPCIGNMILADVKPLHCFNVLNQMQNSDRKSSTIDSTKNLLKRIFESALENEIVSSVPITKTMKYPGNGKTETRWLDVDEEKLFLECAKKHKHYLNFAFILQTGLRYGELTGLKWSDIDLKRGIIHVNRSVSYFQDYGDIQVRPPKTQAGYRDIPLSPIARDILKQMPKEKIVGYENYIFNEDGKPIKRSAYNMQLKRICEDIGIEPISIHKLRHTFATRCIEKGMNPKTLQKILGHSDISTTLNLYVHVSETELQREMKKVFG